MQARFATQAPLRPVLAGALVSIFVSCWSLATPATATSFRLERDDVVAFLGATNLVGLQRSGEIGALLTLAFPDARPRYRDFAWEGDTVFRQGTVVDRWRKDEYGDLVEQLRREKVSVAFAQFGSIECRAGPAGLKAFVEAYRKLLDSLKAAKIRVLVLSPTPFERPQPDNVPDARKQQANLALYVDASRELARDRDLVFVDLFTAFASKGEAERRLTHDGLIVKPQEQSHVARAIAASLGLPLPTAAELGALRPAVVDAWRLWYDYWRPSNTKLLYGDDRSRHFTRGGEEHVSFREEWSRLRPLIEAADARVWRIARGESDPGPLLPEPEVLHGDAAADIERELRAFHAAEGLRVNLFASEEQGLTSPLAIRWDTRGRAFVTVTTTYPHVAPGGVPDDKVILLEDRDGDGRADHSVVFADGLDIPTGLEFGEGGVWIGQGTELLFLRDTDGDDRADVRRVVFSGFGDGDSHQTINSFAWSPGGELWFGQGDGIESRVETPWGPSHLFQAGFYRLRPRRLQLDALLDDFMGPGNPWGIAFDDWGQVFSIDGAGGVTFLSPGQVPTSHRKRLRTIGDPGGYCGIGWLDGAHLPEALQGQFAIGDYKANRVKRFSVRDDGAGFDLEWHEPLLTSMHRNFRPVDVKVGPDGAVYVVDWYNPITCHQDDRYRDPTRDKAHGRVWRLSSSAPPLSMPEFEELPVAHVVRSLAAESRTVRDLAKRELSTRPRERVRKALQTWALELDKEEARYEHYLYEVLCAHEAVELVDTAVLRRVLESDEPRARAYATRVLGRWQDRLDDALSLLAARVVDEHPRVRMEAVLAIAAVPAAASVTVAARVTDLPMDEWIRYAFTQAVHHLRPHWEDPFREGRLEFAAPSHLAALVSETGGPNVIDRLREIVASDEYQSPARDAAIAAILGIGGPEELRAYGLERGPFLRQGTYDARAHSRALVHVLRAATARAVRPTGVLESPLLQWLRGEEAGLREAAVALAGAWTIRVAEPDLLAIARDGQADPRLRTASFLALSRLRTDRGTALLESISAAESGESTTYRGHAVTALAGIDTERAATQAARLLADEQIDAAVTQSVVTAFLERQGGSQHLARALKAADPSRENSRRILRALFSSGRADADLSATLGELAGQSWSVPEFSEAALDKLVSRVIGEGDARRGEEVFRASNANCSTCHRVGDVGGIIGPNLSAIGTTLSLRRITEEVLWPGRQVKEGYALQQVLTRDGRLHQGYPRKTRAIRESGDELLRELESERTRRFARDEIVASFPVGSVMPAGITAALTDRQVLDLLCYLSTLGRAKATSDR